MSPIIREQLQLEGCEQQEVNQSDGNVVKAEEDWYG